MTLSVLDVIADQTEMTRAEQTVCNTPVTSFVCLNVFSSLVLALLLRWKQAIISGLMFIYSSFECPELNAFTDPPSEALK